AQPYGTFAREMLEPQRYPEVKLVPGPDIVRPYDVAAWSLPLMMGVTVEHASLPAGTKPWTPETRAAPGPRHPLPPITTPPPGGESARSLNAALRSGGHVWILPRAASDTTMFGPGTAFLDATAAAAADPLPAGVRSGRMAKVPSGAKPLTAPRIGLYK